MGLGERSGKEEINGRGGGAEKIKKKGKERRRAAGAET